MFRPVLNVFEVGKEIPSLTKQAEACCTSPAAMCYWLTVSLIPWGVMSLIGIFGVLSLRRQQLRSFSPWPSAASPIGFEIDLFIAPSRARSFYSLASCSCFQACAWSASTPFWSGHQFSSGPASRSCWNRDMQRPWL